MIYRYHGDDIMLAKVYEVVMFVINLFALIIGLRFLLLFLGANASGFANFIYTLSAPIVTPFIGIFPSLRVAGSVFETASLLAIAVLYLVGYLVAQLLGIFSRETHVDDVEVHHV